MKYENSPTREFKGIWIPVEIWDDETLTINEKILFLEIDSFTSANKSCFISNEHIAKLLHISENAASKVLNSLVKKGLVVVTKFDGRKRYIQSCTKQTRQKAKADKQKKQVRVGEKDIYYNQDTNINTNEKDKSFSFSEKNGNLYAVAEDSTPSDSFEDIWNEWCEYAKEQHNIKSRMLKCQRETLIEYTKGDAKLARKIIKRAINNGFKMFVPPKDEDNMIEKDPNEKWE